MKRFSRLSLPGLSGPTRALAFGAVGIGCVLAGAKVVAFAQEVVLPTIMRPTVTGETIDGPDPRRRPRLRQAEGTLPRTQRQAISPTRRNPHANALPLEATRKVEPNALRRTSAPSLTPPPPLPAPRRRPDADPYAPLGFNVGSMVLRPALDLDGGYDSNPNRQPGAVKGSTFVRPGVELRANSNWSTHSFDGLLRGSYTAYQNAPSANRPELEARGTLRLDLNQSTNIQTDVRARIGTQSPLSTNLPFSTSERPLTYQYGASLGVNHTINRLTIGLRGDVDRSTFDDAKGASGTTIQQGDRNQTQYAAALRLTYEMTPGLKPFVEVKADTRRRDQSVDAAGYRRDSMGISAKAGAALEVSRTLVGEVAVGYEARKYEDARLRDLRGVIGEASLIWSVSPLTTIGLRATTTLDEATSAGVTGAITRKATMEVAHALLRNLTITGAASVQRADYKGSSLHEESLSGSVRMEYKLNRSLSVRAGFTHERLKSSAPGADYTANMFSAGLRLQY
ncbi:MAG: outer membrane beta-barrel protein [Beijerinckiaceae bacterium]